MKNGQAFVGFTEASIDFPPTFKYDVLKTVKRGKSKKATKDAFDDFVELEEDQTYGEAASLASSFRSKSNTQVDDLPESDDDSDTQPPQTPIMMTTAAAAEAAHKAKKKWLGLAKSGVRKVQHPHTPGSYSGDQTLLVPSARGPPPPSPRLKGHASTTDLTDKLLRLPVMSASSLSQKSPQASDNEYEEDEKGVSCFDSFCMTFLNLAGL